MSIAESTAELVADTAEIEEKAPPAAVAETETEVLETTETAPETTPVDEAPKPRGLDELTDDEIADHPRFKDALARKTEGIRQAEEARQSRLQRDRAANFAPQGLAYLQSAWKDAEESGKQPDWARVQAAFNALSTGYSQLQYVPFKNALMEFLPPSNTSDFEAIENRYFAGRIDEGEFWQQATKLGYEAYEQRRLPDLHKKWEAEFRKSQKTAAEAQQVQQADAERQQRPRPTGTAGVTPGVNGNDNVLTGSYEGDVAAFRRKYGFDL